MATTRKSVIYSVLSNFSSIGTSLILVIIVARWLDPVEIGAFAVAYAVFNLLDPLRRAQIIAFVIQTETLDRALVRGVHFVGWVTTTAVMAITALIVLLMAGPLGTPETGRLLLILSIGFVVSTLVQPAFAALSRDMRFGIITSIEVTGGVIKACVTVLCLLAGLRAEAIAWGVVAEIAAKLVFMLRVERQYVFAVPTWANTGRIWSFCVKYTGAQFLPQISTAMAEIIVGSFLGLAAAGFYNRAAVLARTLRSGIEGAIMPVALAVFARSNREQEGLLRQNYLIGISLLTGVTWSALGVFIAIADPFILTVYGPRWAATIPLAQVISAAAIIHATTAMAPVLLASIGRVDALFWRNMIIVVPRLLILGVTAQYSLMAVVWGGFASMLIAFAVNQTLLWREFGIGMKELTAALWRSAAVAVLSAGAALAVLQIPAVAVLPVFLQVPLSLSVAGIVWLTALFLVRHELWAELTGMLRKLRLHSANRT